jgi:hypothetical protein
MKLLKRKESYMFHIKSKNTEPGCFPKTGIILDPSLYGGCGGVRSDEELYKTLQSREFIKIAIFDDQAPWIIKEIKDVSFPDFEKDWKGD